MSPRLRRACITALILAIEGCGLSLLRPSVMRRYESENLVSTMRQLVDSFVKLERRAPESLLEACTRLTPDLPHYDGRACEYWLPGGDTLPLDGWRRPLHYSVSKGDAIIRSAGDDGVLETSDDIINDVAAERVRVHQLRGCYRVESRRWRRFAGESFWLDSSRVGPGWYRAGPLLGGYRSASWHLSSAASEAGLIEVVWRQSHSAVWLKLHAHSDSLVGTMSMTDWTTTKITARRSECPVG